MIHERCPDCLAITKDAELCKFDDFWLDASKIIDFLRALGWEASDLWKWEKFG